MSSHIYRKGDTEYRDNGIYVIANRTYMSLWAFKRRRGDTYPSEGNADTGRRIARLNLPSIATKPDYGNFESVMCYDKLLLSELKFI